MIKTLFQNRGCVILIKRFFLICLFFLSVNNFVFAQDKIRTKKYSAIFKDTINVCRTNSGSLRGVAFDTILNMCSLKGKSTREIIKLFGKPYKVREPNEPNSCGEKEDLIWIYPISCGCFNNELNYETCDVATFYFYKRRLVCVDGWKNQIIR